MLPKGGMSVEPVQQPLQSNSRRLLILSVAAILLLSTSFFFLLQHRQNPNRTPITVAELDNRLMETGGEEFVQLPAPSPSDRKLIEAQEALAARQPDRALQLANEMLAVDAKNVTAHIILGRSYFRTGELDKAAKAFSKAIEIKPDLPEAYLYRGHLHKANKRYDQALADYNQALGLNPELSAAYYHRGDVGLLTNELDDAMANFTLAIVKKSGVTNPPPTPYFKRGYLLYLQQDHKAAVKDLSRAIELAPAMYEAYLYRANALCALRRHDMAIRDYNTLIQLKPDFALAYYGRALALREKGDTEKAEADFRKAEQLGIKRLQ
jgi:tetratricopeptide (TPR) repeat protein